MQQTKINNNNSAAALLLKEINNLKEKIEGLEYRNVMVTPYEMIPNAPNSIVRISSQPDALIVEYADWTRQFIPICITQCMRHW